MEGGGGGVFLFTDHVDRWTHGGRRRDWQDGRRVVVVGPVAVIVVVVVQVVVAVVVVSATAVAAGRADLVAVHQFCGAGVRCGRGVVFVGGGAGVLMPRSVCGRRGGGRVSARLGAVQVSGGGGCLLVLQLLSAFGATVLEPDLRMRRRRE